MSEVVLYGRAGCYFCEKLSDFLRNLEEVKRLEIVYVNSSLAAKELLVRYPQMSCDLCVDGLSLPFTTHDGELVGGYDATLFYFLVTKS